MEPPRLGVLGATSYGLSTAKAGTGQRGGLTATYDFTKAGCLTILRGFDSDLEDLFPCLHIYVHNG